MRRILSIAATTLLFALFSFQVCAQTDTADDPVTVVNRLQAALADVSSRSSELDFDARFRELEPVIDASHDFEAIAHLAGRAFWNELTDEQRSQFVDAFRRSNIAAYASRFTADEGVKFDQAAIRDELGKRIMVRSYLLRPNGSKATFDYVLQNPDGHWRIVMVLVDGVSELALKRSQLTSLYQDSGFQGVMDYLEKEASGEQ